MQEQTSFKGWIGGGATEQPRRRHLSLLLVSLVVVLTLVSMQLLALRQQPTVPYRALASVHSKYDAWRQEQVRESAKGMWLQSRSVGEPSLGVKSGGRQAPCEAVGVSGTGAGKLAAEMEEFWQRQQALDASWPQWKIREALMYWKYRRAIPQPGPDLLPEPEKTQYITFEPDIGGWNNIRMQMELLIVLAKVTQRTLVLPAMYHNQIYGVFHMWGQNDGHVTELFSAEGLSQWLPVISMEEYLDRRGLAQDHPARYNQTELRQELCEFPAACPAWDCNVGVIPFPDLEAVQARSEYPRWSDFTIRPGSDVVKLTELTPEHHQQHTLHFTSDEHQRLFGHAATCFYFPSSAWHRWAFGGLRRHFHYTDQVMQNASLVLHRLLQDIGPFNAVHFRNTDLALQYESFAMTPAAIRDRLLQQFDPQQGLFIATEKPDRDYLRPLLDAFPKARFLDQYIDHLPGTPQRFYGLLDQVVASCACTFVGTLGSTFSSFIVRIRGHLPPALAPNKGCYFTVKNVTGDAIADDEWTRSMLYPVAGSTQWELPIWSRDYSVMWELD